MAPPEVPPFSELSQFTLDRESLRLLPESFCRRLGVAVMGRVDPANKHSPVTVAMLHPDDLSVRYRIADFLRRPVQPVRLNRYEIDAALEVGFGAGAHAAVDVVLRAGTPLSATPTPVELVNHVLTEAVEQNASDIHLESYADDVDLRYRCDGILHQTYTDIAPDTLPEVVSRIKVMAGLDISERRRPQDGRLRALYQGPAGDKAVDFRVSVVPSPAGEDVVIRLLDATVGLVPVEKLGMTPEVQATVLRLLGNPEGLVLVTGPTGSGKTTTLYAALARLNDGRKKIITAEDPIEYVVPKVNQKQVSAQLPHLTLLRALLRQDPNVMLVGEIRDQETGSTALMAASTGHVVLGTLHTADAVGAVSRLRGLKLEDGDIAEALLAVLAQRLVRRICPECSAPATPTPEQVALLGPLLDGLQARAGRGCEACRHTGFKGRVGLFELLVVDPDLQLLIATGAPVVQLRRHARARGFRTLVEDALAKVADGVTTLHELTRVVPYRYLVSAREERKPVG
ncbi:type II/IV secretion system protein [Corallococcus sp. CA053C]|uniref:GspE/PulE family protein n=1 Tax=Corallococcus sp. CA053C TaxID=2316732 RepID=UPI000EA22D2C|nr:GspE/PulE family protein [Corallococcus sp. CA053C]RKH11092.1 type II/IV secretion system protein [Corallococcus sp. CA053C]